MSNYDLHSCDLPELDSIVYLTGVSTAETREAGRESLGLLATPASSVHLQRGQYTYWGADNGCFGERRPGGKAFDLERWLAWLADCGPEGCLFVTLPDVLNWIEVDGKLVPVGDPVATWARSEPLIETVKALGFPVAVVLQDGLEDHPEIWAQILERCDAVFVGGSDDWKLGAGAAGLIADARAHGLWVHVGRVNSKRRLLHCAAIGADSADGTMLAFGPKANWPRLCRMLDAAEAAGKPEMPVAA